MEPCRTASVVRIPTRPPRRAAAALALGWALALASVGCAGLPPAARVPGFLVPAGRLLANGGAAELLLDGNPVAYRVETDAAGGTWLALPLDQAAAAELLTVRLTRFSADAPYADRKLDAARWTGSDYYLDAEAPTIAAKAAELTAGLANKEAKIAAIFGFVRHSITWRLVSAVHFKTASATLALGAGICVGKSRLFVALLRAAGIPARTVQGAVRGDDGGWYHHGWAEYVGSDGLWHQSDPTSNREDPIADAGHLLLVVDYEANEVHPFVDTWEKGGYRRDDGSVSAFIADWKLQNARGVMPFRILADPAPGGLAVEYDYRMEAFRRLF